MGMRELETAVLCELRMVTGKRNLRKKDIREWSTGEIEVQPDELKVYLPALKINVAILRSLMEERKETMTVFQVLVNGKAPVHVGVSELAAQAVVRALQNAFIGLNIEAAVTMSSAE